MTSTGAVAVVRPPPLALFFLPRFCEDGRCDDAFDTDDLVAVLLLTDDDDDVAVAVAVAVLCLLLLLVAILRCGLRRCETGSGVHLCTGRCASIG